MTNPVAIQLDLDIDLRNVRRRGQEIGNILERSLNRNTRLQALTHLERQIDQVRQRVRGIQTDLQRAMTTPVETPRLAQMTRELENQRQVLLQIIDEHAQINNLTRQQAEAQVFGGRHNISTYGGIMTIREINQLTQAYQRLERQQNALAQSPQGWQIDQEAVERFRHELDVTTDRMHELILRHQELSYSSGNSIQNALQPMINFNQEISQTIGAVSQAFGPYVQAAQMAMQGLVKVTEMEIKALKTMGVVAISAFKPLASLAEGAASAISKIFSSIKKHNETTMKNLWRNVLRYGIGVRSMYFLIRKIRAAIGDVINELSKQIPEVNAQMSAFKTAVNGLKGALATAFQPILTAVLPALTALINAVSKAIAVVGKFIALLTGQNFVYAATATQVNYAKSLEKTGSAAKKAKKELEGYLSPIDEINKYQSKKDDDADSGGGGGADSPYTLKKVPIEDWIKDLWNRIRKAWQNADFFELGKMLGDKLAKMLANIPWDKIRNEARRLGKSLATLLNGIMYGEYDGKSLGYWIGHTLANAINTAFDFVNQFAKNFDWKKLGQTIVDAIKGVFENLDWNVITETFGELGKGIGKTIAEIFADPDIFNEMGDALGRLVNAIVDMIYNFFNQQSGIDIGLAIARFINSAVDQFDPNDFAAMVNKIMEVLLNALITGVSVTKWDKIGEKIAQAINGIDFKMIFGKYKDLANNIIDGILTMLESFLDTLTPEKITEIGESIADFINGLDWQPERLASTANRLLHALLNIILTTVREIDWDKIANDVATFLGEIDWIGILLKVGAIKDKIELGIFKILLNAFVAVAQKIKTQIFNLAINVMDGFIEGLSKNNPVRKVLEIFRAILVAIKGFFGIHSPSTVFIEIGGDIVQGFIDGVKAIIDKAKAIWTQLKTDAITWFNNIKKDVIDKAKLLKDGVIGKYNELKSKVVSIIIALKGSVSNIWESLKSTIIRIVTNIKTNISNIVTNIKSIWISVWTSVKTTTVSIFNGLWTGIKGVINTILAGIESMVNGIIKGINFAVNALNTLSIDPPEWIKEKYGIGTIGFDIPKLNEVSIPRLAQGAVIPPNKEFMAVLGDQKSGTNIETPLSTMVEAFNQALRSNDVGGVKQINFLLPDRRTLAQYTIAGGRIIQTSTGKNPFELA